MQGDISFKRGVGTITGALEVEEFDGRNSTGPES